MKMPRDEDMQEVTIKRWTEGHYDSDGAWVEGSEKVIAISNYADIQPRSGRERVAELKTKYESDYRMFVGSDDIEFDPEDELSEDEPLELLSGDKVEDEQGKEYTITFPANWSSHYECDLKLKEGE